MIKLFAMDVDGTLTDGNINISEKGEIFKSFNAKDGLGINLLINNNITPVVITGRTSKIINFRMNELGVKYIYQNVQNKLDCLKKICKDMNISLNEVAYIGDDINDIEILKNVGYSFCPSDSVIVVKQIVDHVCSLPCGNGAVREAIDILLEKIK